MSEPNKIEDLLRASSSAGNLPDDLRANVLDGVSKQLQRKTFFDDLKLLCACAGVLLAVTGCFWLSMDGASDELRQLTQTKWDSTKGDFPTQRFSLTNFDNEF